MRSLRLPSFFAFALGVVITDAARVALADDVDAMSDDVVVCDDCTESPTGSRALSLRHASACVEVVR